MSRVLDPGAQIQVLCARMQTLFLVRWASRVAFVLAFLGVVLFVSPALAAGKAIAVYVEGTNTSEVRKQILESVPKTLDVIDPEAFQSALVKAGQKGPLGNVIAVPKMRDKTLKTVRKAVENAKVEAAVIARTRKAKGGGDEVYLIYIDAIPGDLAVDEAVPLKGSSSERATAIKNVLGSHLEQIAPAAAPEEKKKPDEEKPEETVKKPDEQGGGGKDKVEEPPSKRAANNVGTAIFVIGANVEFAGRRFKYTDNAVNSQNLRPYDVFGTPLLAVDGEVYPAATTGVPVASDIGLVAAYAQAFGLSSETSDGLKFGTTWRRWYAGLRYRLRIGEGPTAPIIGFSARFGMTTFTFDPDDAKAKTITAELPSVKYTYFRPGLDARIPLGPVAILAGFGYDAVLNAGNVYDRFTDAHAGTKGSASIGAIDADLGLAVGIIAGLEGRLVAEYSRYFYKFSPVPGDDYVAGGALDELLALRVGLAYAY